MRHFTIAFLITFFTAFPLIAAEPIKIGLSLGRTGHYAEMSDMQIKAFQLWEKDINRKGGMQGQKG